MAKGSRCPSCGELKFHTDKGIYECSACGAIGWWKTPKSPGAGKGSECKSCGSQTTKNVAAKGNVEVWHCFTCEVTYIT